MDLSIGDARNGATWIRELPDRRLGHVGERLTDFKWSAAAASGTSARIGVAVSLDKGSPWRATCCASKPSSMWAGYSAVLGALSTQASAGTASASVPWAQQAGGT